ncbi:hypothetical protein GW756_04410 [bacterium]|nr:hypothetical protein [bacterium]NCQ55157.1 hypothetical protein [Candidatus Parcubacteria bacterium]NCS67330.1 hypothetical protein [Candidatus Peregrinibacteria bacterium]NCS96585.1 hypothetical protein [bacterium]
MKLLAKVLLGTKFFALSCIAFMSTTNALVLPCHDIPEIEKANCEACILSLEAWSEPLIENQNAIVLETNSITVSPFFFEPPLVNLKEQSLEIRPPPPDLKLWRGEEIFQEQIKLRL